LLTSLGGQRGALPADEGRFSSDSIIDNCRPLDMGCRHGERGQIPITKGGTMSICPLCHEEKTGRMTVDYSIVSCGGTSEFCRTSAYQPNCAPDEPCEVCHQMFVRVGSEKLRIEFCQACHPGGYPNSYLSGRQDRGPATRAA
jgi:hypothetical protein